ncbi:choice-of-anchor L domain-containing protein [Tenacibaculum agarivorans]|uniref:choice-of-anchor L domain-containing protein n=1 Tax=Tenacibaculum agarivorans TaxID=1908389 RepID=UPI00094B8A7D|nr:choice-of-anchor L domain-containing protein [Tenacibaculum agarivorans]
MRKICLIILLLFFGISSILSAQVRVNNTADPEASFDPAQLITDVLVTGNCTTVSNVTSSVRDATDLGQRSYGFFKKQTGSNFPFDEGIVLTSGTVGNIGISGADLDSPSTGRTDTDLSTAIGESPTNIIDASAIEFDFVPKGNRISFRYLMASNEYHVNFPCNFADGFAFLLRKTTETDYTNIALLPGTTTPVSITNVHNTITGVDGCPAQNAIFFHGSDFGETGFRGRTVVLTAEATVEPNVAYHIKLVVADFSDERLDTAIFLEKGSFNLGLDLGEDQILADGNSVCDNEKLLTSNVDATTYKWFKDGSEILGETNKSYLANLGNGTYTCEVDLGGGCTDKDSIVLEFSEPPLNNTSIPDISSCNTNIIDLTSRFNDVLNGQNPTIFEVAFYSDAGYTTLISNPNNYTLPSDNETIYVRKTNKIATHCFVDSSFKVMVTTTPTASQPADYEVCDDNVSGTDTDDFFNNFILSTKDNVILGSLSPTQYSVTYHTTMSGAQTNATTDLIDKTIPYRNTNPKEQTIYVRVENIANTNCFIASDPTTSFKPFKLVVHPLPIIVNNPAQIKQCDTNFDLTSTVNLTQAQISISNNHTNETFKYYRSETDANNDTSEITDPVNVTATNGDSFWVRTISNKGCYRVSKLDVIISFFSDIAYNKEFTACDDFLDPDGNDTKNNDDTDGISNFDLSNAIDEIKAPFTPAVRNNLDILFFESETDRDAVTNQIKNPSSYRNTKLPAITPQTIFIKIINKINNDCTGLGKLFIKVNPLPKFTVTSPQILCLNAPSPISAEMPSEDYNYEWTRNGNPTVIGNTQELDILQGGTYQVKAIDKITNCEKTKTIIVDESIIASITLDDITINDDTTNNTITINESSSFNIKNYEFALEDQKGKMIRDFQKEPFFENLSGGIYTILIREINGCGTSRVKVSVLEFPNFFTPNNDGENDTWIVKGGTLDFYPKSNITIFDRFGKIITSFKVNDEGWDGLYKGKMLTPSDYWFSVELTDTRGNVVNRRGHFSLLRE